MSKGNPEKPPRETRWEIFRRIITGCLAVVPTVLIRDTWFAVAPWPTRLLVGIVVFIPSFLTLWGVEELVLRLIRRHRK